MFGLTVFSAYTAVCFSIFFFYYYFQMVQHTGGSWEHRFGSTGGPKGLIWWNIGPSDCMSLWLNHFILALLTVGLLTVLSQTADLLSGPGSVLSLHHFMSPVTPSISTFMMLTAVLYLFYKKINCNKPSIPLWHLSDGFTTDKWLSHIDDLLTGGGHCDLLLWLYDFTTLTL